MTQSELADRLGISKSTISMYEIGDRTPSALVYEALADIFNVDLDYLYLKSPIRSRFTVGVALPEEVVYIPLLGRVAAGTPITALENRIGTVSVSRDVAKDDDLFALRISGDSMSPRIYDGDIVIVKSQSDADSGQIVIALINGDDAVCKKLVKYDGGIALTSLNPAYTPMYFKDSDIESYPVRILGVVVELRSKL